MAAANYEIRIKGRISDSLLPVFEGLAVTTEPVPPIPPDLQALADAAQDLSMTGRLLE